MFTKRLSVYLFVTILIISVNKANAKSVYAITDHGYIPYPHPSKVCAYKIDSDQIDLQVMCQYDDVNYPTGVGLGPVGLAIDSDSGYMFVTHESMNPYNCKGIQIIDAVKMIDYGWIDAPGASGASVDLAGIVYDHDTGKVYTIDRDTNDLFVYSWNAQTKTLTLDGGGFGLEGLDGDLMLPDAKASLAARPERLASKSQKFYNITPKTTISAKRKLLDAQRFGIKISNKDILEWLDKIWFDGGLKERMTEERYLELRKAIENLLQ